MSPASPRLTPRQRQRALGWALTLALGAAACATGDTGTATSAPTTAPPRPATAITSTTTTIVATRGALRAETASTTNLSMTSGLATSNNSARFASRDHLDRVRGGLLTEADNDIAPTLRVGARHADTWSPGG